MSDQILELSALAPERPKARLRWADNEEGEVYELAVPEDFGAVSLTRIGQKYAEMEQLWEAAKRTKAQDRRLESLLDSLATSLIPEAPAEAVKALPAIEKRAVALGFFIRAGERTVAHLPPEVSRLISESS